MVVGLGYIVGVINYFDVKKYQYWINEDVDVVFIEDWWEGVMEYFGLWWDDWDIWLLEKLGDKVLVCVLGDGDFDVIEDVLGWFVKVCSQECWLIVES